MDTNITSNKISANLFTKFVCHQYLTDMGLQVLSFSNNSFSSHEKLMGVVFNLENNDFCGF
tara:strand:- start:236 stop:418 length:183 start_codon:yes stop_codon:yes gene_type:complete